MSRRDPGLPESAYARANIELLYHQSSGDPRWLDAAVADLHAAGDDPEEDGWTRTHARYLLGQALVGRYRLTGDFDDLEWGLRHLEQAVEETPSDDGDRAKRLEFFASSLLTAVERFSIGEEPALVRGHLRRATASLTECVDVTVPEHPNRAWRLSSLGNAFRLRFEHFGEIGDLREAIATQHEAKAAAESADSEQRAGVCANLGTALFRSYEVAGDRSTLEAAVEAFRSAVANSSPHSPYHRSHLQNLAQALAAANEENGAVDAVSDAAVDPGAIAVDGWSGEQPAPELQFLRDRGRRAEQAERWREAAAAYAAAQRRLDSLIQTQVTRRFRERQLRESIDLAVQLAYARFRSDDPDGALMALEHGRARLLSEAVGLSTLDADRLRAAGHPELADALVDATAAVRKFDTSSLDPDTAAGLLGGERVRLLRRRLEAVLAKVGAIPGFQDPFQPPTAAQIRQLATGGALVYVAAAPAGGLGVVVPPEAAGEVATVPLPGLRADPLVQHARDFLRAYEGRREDREAWMRAIDASCRWLWDEAMEPLLGALVDGGNARVALVPFGWLGLFPLHAAWTHDSSRPTGRRYVLDEALLTYAPNARSLAAARRVATRPLFENVLIVAHPQPAPQVLDPLAHTRLEADMLLQILPDAHVLTDAAATKADVAEALTDCSLAHLACHGQSMPGQPLRSHVLLADGAQLEAHELMARRLDRTRLVVLSACETAAVGRSLPDEAVGLPSAVLQAGAAGVVASLWAVPDPSAALLMHQFHRHLVEHRDPPAALQHAQTWLRDVTNGELLRAGLEDFFDDPQRGHPGDSLWEASQRYDHPYYWAAFTYSGA